MIRTIISDYTQESGVRGLRKRLETLCRASAVQIVRGKGSKVVVTKENLRDFLDMHPVYHKQVKESARPGIVTGLAWTAAGGEILITGQLGDVMKESARIAVTLVKSLFPEKSEIFEENDLHIHVPDGATPKDGPSAGITLTTALSSLITGLPVPPNIGMTGEVSLQGGVNPIGGLPEKLLAAQRAGVKKVFIPEDNIDDLRDVPDEVKENLEIVPVSESTEVLRALGLLGS